MSRSDVRFVLQGVAPRSHHWLQPFRSVDTLVYCHFVLRIVCLSTRMWAISWQVLLLLDVGDSHRFLLFRVVLLGVFPTMGKEPSVNGNLASPSFVL